MPDRSHGAVGRRSAPTAQDILHMPLIRFRRLAPFLALLVFVGCGYGAPPAATRAKPRLVLLYATCSLNADYLWPYNDRVAYTPHLKAFAQKGRVFERHHTESGQSGISYAALFTGSQAMTHGVYSHPARLVPELTTITEAFAGHGFETHFWNHHGMASADLGYGQGVPPEHVHSRDLEAGDPQLTALLSGLARDHSRRAFVLTNFTVTHRTYGVDRVQGFCDRYPAECGGLSVAELTRYGRIFEKENVQLSYDFDKTIARLGLTAADTQTLIRALEVIYKSRVEYLDELFGQVVAKIEAAGLLDEAAIAFTADHGEVLYRPNVPFKWTHGFYLAAEDIFVPLVLVAPGVTPGRYPGVSRSIDVFPTLTGLSGFNVAGPTGVDLSATLLTGGEGPPLTAYSHTSLVPVPFLKDAATLPVFNNLFPSADVDTMWVSARQGDMVYKLRRLNRRDAPPEAYDYGRDRTEQNNVFDIRLPQHQRILEDLKKYRLELVRGYFRRGPNQVPEKEQIERLRSLGYIR